MKILLLEDDAILAESIKEYLEIENYYVDISSEGEDVFERTFETKYDLYILDINVPGTNGFDTLKALREAEDHTPAIYISALTDIGSIHQGFDIGAIDYIKKPFDPEELVLRIKNHFRTKSDSLIYKEIKFNPTTGEVDYGDEHLFLGEVQKNIFNKLLSSVGAPVSSEDLMESLEKPNPNALRVSINKLKKRLDLNIRNIRGQGYILEKV